MQEPLLQTTAVFYLVGVAFAGDFSHFTWWNVLLFAVYCGMGPRRARLHLTVFVLNLCVVVVVLGMSVTRCRLLGDAHRAWGPWGYGLGNLLLHYIPSLVVARVAPPTTLQAAAQAVLAAAILTVFVVFEDFSTVYGCRVPRATVQLAVLGLLGLAGLGDDMLGRLQGWGIWLTPAEGHISGTNPR